MKLFIPPLDTQIVLTQAWTFDLYNEARNMTLLRLMGDTRKKYQRYHWLEHVALTGVATTLPAGTVLKVDRIYIRRGNKDFDSVTFVMPKQVVNFHEADPRNHLSEPFRKPVRFWVKLADTNTIECRELLC